MTPIPKRDPAPNLRATPYGAGQVLGANYALKGHRGRSLGFLANAASLALEPCETVGALGSPIASVARAASLPRLA